MIGPNASLSVRGAWIFMGLVSTGTLGCAACCTWMGYWPVLPFAGLELAAVAWALTVSMRRNRYREVVSFGPARVRVEFGMAGRGAAVVVDLPRGWTRAWIEAGERRHQPGRLLLGSSGQRVEIGRCLTDDEREALLKRFRELLRVPVVAAATQVDMNLGEA